MAVAIRHNLYVLSDEMYEHLVYDGLKSTCLATLGPEAEARTIVVSGFSKTYSMTGWRLGTLVAPAADRQGRDGAPEPDGLERHDVRAVRGPRRPQGDGKDGGIVSTDARRLRPAPAPRSTPGSRRFPGVSCVLAQGAFYLFPNISSFGLGSLEFCERLLEKEKVAAVPGTAFGAEGYLRLSYATSDEIITKGVARIANFCRSLKG